MVDVQKDVGAHGTCHRRVLVSDDVITLLRGDVCRRATCLQLPVSPESKRQEDAGLVPLYACRLRCASNQYRVADDAVDISGRAPHAAVAGVEMEALTAVSVAALTVVVVVVKAVDPAAVITDVRVREKTGGASGDWTRCAMKLSSSPCPTALRGGLRGSWWPDPGRGAACARVHS